MSSIAGEYLYFLTRMGGARDWGTGLPLKASLIGKMSRLEVHHIFPKAQLYKRKHPRPEVNALANFCFLTTHTNLDMTDVTGGVLPAGGGGASGSARIAMDSRG